MNVPLRAYAGRGNKRPMYIGVFPSYEEAVKAATKVAPPAFPPTQPVR